MKKLVLAAGFVFVVLTVDAQYYYDRSKSPERIVSPTVKTVKDGRDFDHFFFLSWDNNTPSSNPGFINSASSAGMKIGYRKRINSVDRLWVGGDFGYAVYKQYMPMETYQYANTAITTDLYNYAYNYSLTLNIDYFFRPMEKIVVPYFGLGVGVAADKFAQYYNIYSSGPVTSWGVQARPEVGVLIGFGENSSWRIKAAYHYDYASNSANLVNNNFITPGDNNYTGFINSGFQIGIVKMAW